GDYIDSIELADRMIFTNMSVEIGAKNGYIAPDKKVFDYLEKRGIKKDRYEAIYPDADAEYAETLEIDVSKIDPVAAAPHSVDNVQDVKEFANIKVDQVLIGTCTNGRIEDFRMAAEILKGKKIHKDTRLLILPASSEIYIKAMEEGLLKIFIEAGGIVLNPGCGPCLGAHEGAMAPGEVTVSTANRNFKGRMGCNQSDIYLVNPAVAAATAIKGYLTVPEKA
ncbi:MAG TPA: aconitase family protein, partial [bacterium]|nr:aconitase family protein [bacterium]